MNLVRILATLPALLLITCVPGGIVIKGGYANEVGILPAASKTNGAAYSILCWDQVEADRREKLPEEERPKEPPIRSEEPTTFKGNCDEEGESSVFFLFNFVPVTPPINPEYAIGSAVQRLEGDTMINIKSWHETHYYSILGRVSVFKVKGRIIKFKSIGAPESDKKDIQIQPGKK